MKKNYRIPSVDTAFSLDKDYKKRYNEKNAFLEGFNSVGTVKKNQKGTDMLYKKGAAIKTLPLYQSRESKVEKKTYNPDAIEFGENSETYKILQDLSKRWYATSDSAEKDRLHGVAEKVRMYHRQNTPVPYKHDEIMNLLHENKKKAQAYQKTMTEGLPGFLYRMSGGNYMLDSSAYLIGMVDKGEWDYKYNDYWRVKYDYFDGEYMDTPDSNYRNWKPWMYFDGYLISADKLGNMNMAYVGKNMGLAEWVYKNFETTDKDDEFWVQYGIDLANSGR